MIDVSGPGVPHADEAGNATDALPALDTVLLLVRHAEQTSLRVRDAPLSPRGHRQAGLLAERVARLPVTAVVSSTLVRARETARAVALACKLEPEVEDGLEEVHLADGERMRRYTSSAAREMEPGAGPDGYVRSALAMVRVLPGVRWGSLPGAEPIEALRERGLAAVDRVLARHRGGVVVCVSHGGTINALLGAWIGATPDLWFVPWHTGISTVAIRGATHLVLGVNDATHLSADQEMLNLVTRSLGTEAVRSG